LCPCRWAKSRRASYGILGCWRGRLQLLEVVIPSRAATWVDALLTHLVARAAKAHPADASYLQPGLAPDRGQGVVDSAPTGAAAVGAEAMMADPPGPITFSCPLAVRSTCPPARCPAATISLACLERQRFGVACCFTAMLGQPQHPAGTSTVPSWAAEPAAGEPCATAGRRAGSLIRDPPIR
jgi:hypothetical protein